MPAAGHDLPGCRWRGHSAGARRLSKPDAAADRRDLPPAGRSAGKAAAAARRRLQRARLQDLRRTHPPGQVRPPADGAAPRVAGTGGGRLPAVAEIRPAGARPAGRQVRLALPGAGRAARHPRHRRLRRRGGAGGRGRTRRARAQARRRLPDGRRRHPSQCRDAGRQGPRGRRHAGASPLPAAAARAAPAGARARRDPAAVEPDVSQPPARRRRRGARRVRGAAGFCRQPRRTGVHTARWPRRFRPCGRQRAARLPSLRPAGAGNVAGGAMKAWLGRLSLRYKLTLSALAVEAVMLSFLIAHGVQVTTQALQEQAAYRVGEVAKTLEAALLAPLMQQDDASVRDIVESLRDDSGLQMIEVRDSSDRLVHQTGIAGKATVFRLTQPVEFSGKRYGEVGLALSSDFIREAQARYIRQSLGIAVAALLLTGILLALSTGGVVRRFEALTRASKRMTQGDLDVRLAAAGEDEIGQLVETFNRMAESVRFNVERARENEERFHAIADYTHDLEFWLSPEGRLLWVNPSVERMLGYSVGECMGQIDFQMDIIHPEDRVAAAFQLRQPLRGTSGQGYTLRICRKDGGHFWAAVNWQPIHNYSGEYQGIRASIHSIDDLKATEANLRQAIGELRAAQSLQRRYLEETEQERARLVSLLSAMNLGILFVAADGHVIYHNPTFSRIWLIEEGAALIGQPVDAVLAKAASTLARPDHFSRHLLSVLETRELSDSFEIQMTDGRVIT